MIHAFTMLKVINYSHSNQQDVMSFSELLDYNLTLLSVVKMGTQNYVFVQAVSYILYNCLFIIRAFSQ
jgi:hypothetical protein